MYFKKKAFSLPKSLKVAMPVERLTSFLADLTFLFLVSCLLLTLLQGIGLILSFILFFTYFPLCHFLFSQTVGKKIFALRLIGYQGQTVTLFQVFMREYVGRFLSVLFLFWGYIQIFFDKNHLGFHDEFSSTVVISEKRRSSWAFCGLAYALMIFSCSLYLSQIFFKTPAAGMMISFILQQKGMKVSGFKGNPRQGWQIPSLVGKYGSISYELKDIRVFHDIKDFYKSDMFYVKKIEIGELQTKIDEDAFQLDFLKASSSPKRIVAVPQIPYFLAAIKASINEVQLKKWVIYRQQQPILTLQNLQAVKFDFTDGLLSIRDLSSADQKIRLWNSHFSLLDGNFDLRLKAHIPKQTFSFLKRDLDMSLFWSGPSYFPRQFSWNSFDNKLQMELTQNGLVMQVYNLTPDKYFVAPSIFKNISFKMRNTECRSMSCLNTLSGQGSFYMQNRKIDFKNQVARPSGDELEVLQFNVSDLLYAQLAPRPVLKVITEEDIKTFLSGFYFNKNWQDLGVNEQNLIVRDQVYYKTMKERFDPNRPTHRDTFLIRSPSQLKE